MKKSPPGTIEAKLARFLFRYRITPHSTTGVPPSELLMGKRLRSTLDQLLPSVAQRVERSQAKQKQGHDCHAKSRLFQLGDAVSVRGFGTGLGKSPNWLAGSVLEQTGPLSFQIELEDGRLVRRHIDHIRIHTATEVDAPPTETSAESQEPEDYMDGFQASQGSSSGASAPEPCRSVRVRQPPDRYM